MGATRNSGFVTYRIKVPAAGTYTVQARAKTYNDRGTFQLAIADSSSTFVNHGNPTSLYTATPSYRTYNLPEVSFGSGGNKLFKFLVTGKEQASKGYTLAFDTLTLTSVAKPGDIDVSPNEYVYSGVRGTTSAAQNVVIKNLGDAPLEVTELGLSGATSDAFGLTSVPSVPFTLVPGDSTTVGVHFAPSSTQIGALEATLQLTSDDPDEGILAIGLYGLSAKGEQGSNEPPLQQIVDTLGYAIDVGSKKLILGTAVTPLGDEVPAQLFQKATAGVVSIRPVARYSPDDPLPFGYYTMVEVQPVHEEVGTIARGYEQSLNPELTQANDTSFEPGLVPFGFYVDSTSYAAQKNYTQDMLNTGPLVHAVRAYPLKDRAGQPLANTYLLAFEPASNGDYQDYVFVVNNVKPVPQR